MNTEGKSKFYTILSSLSQTKWRIAFKGVLVGLGAGLLVAFYRMGMEFGTEKAVQAYAFLRQHPWALAPWLGLIIAVGWCVARLVKYEPMASGSGIPQVEGMVIHGLAIKAVPVLLVRYAASFLTAFFGLSLGREGPSIQIGAAGGQLIAKKTCATKMEENHLITAGAAAGLAAAFSAPLSGVMFALEEVHRSFSPIILITATTASLTANIVATLFFGLRPVLSFTQTPQLPPGLYWWLLPLGILSGLIGSLVNKGLLAVQTLYGKLPAVLRPMAALLIALPVGLFLPGLLGGGSGLISTAETARSGAALLLLFLSVKILFTFISFGSGAPGGIFLPILSIGALTGGAFGLVAVRFGVPARYVADFAVCGMAGALTGSVKAPVTSILLTAEMTGSLVHLFPVAACSFIALLISDVLRVTPIYEALLERIMKGDAKAMRKKKPGGILEAPVELGSPIAGKRIREIRLPKGVLIAGIQRGERRIVPNGDTEVMPGDYLVVISSEMPYCDVSEQMRALCRSDL